MYACISAYLFAKHVLALFSYVIAPKWDKLVGMDVGERHKLRCEAYMEDKNLQYKRLIILSQAR